MARRRQWRMMPGETRDLAVSLESELDSGASMTGETPEVSVWTGDEDAGYTAAVVTISNEQVNTGQLTTEDGETIAVGEGIAFRITAPSTRATYTVRSECDADDGTHVSRFDTLIVEGPAAP